MHEIAPPPPRKRVQPLRALRAIRDLIRNPDDTTKVFDIIDALSGNAGSARSSASSAPRRDSAS